MSDVKGMATEGLELMRIDRLSMPTSRDILAVLFRRQWLVLTTFAVVVIGVALSGAWIPEYEAHLKLLVRRQRADPIITPWSEALPQFVGDRVSEEDLNSTVELLKSEGLLRKVVLATGLDKTQPLASDVASNVRITAAVLALGQDLKIQVPRKSNVVSVSYQSRDPETAAKVLKALATEYVQKHMEVYRPPGDIEFFDQQAERFRRSLDEAQQQLTEFAKESGVVSAQVERDTMLQRASEFDSAGHQAQAGAVEIEQRIRTLEAQLKAVQPRMTTVMRTSDNEALLQQLKSTLLNLELKKTELLTRYEPGYRLVQEIEEQIADTRKAIGEEERKPIREETTDQDPNYQWIRAELTKAQADLSGLLARASTNASLAQQYRAAARRTDERGVVQQDLVRTAKAQEENYLLYTRKREEARISAALDERGILNVSVFEQPSVPAFPTRSPVIVGLLALAVAVIVSLSTAFAVDSMDPTFRTPDELASRLGIPVLATLSKGGEGRLLAP